MALLRGLIHRLSKLFSSSRVRRELDEEIRFHLEHEIQKNMLSGMDEAEAVRQAKIDFGGVENIREQVSEESGVRWLEDFVQDVRYGLRGLRKAPVFTAAALISLGVGIGANTAAFSVVNGVLLNPLPYPEQERLHSLRVEWPTFSGPLADADFLGLEQQIEDFSAIVGYGTYGLTLMTPEGPRVIQGAWVTDGMNDVFGIHPAVGRGFKADDELVALVSHEFWQSYLAGTEQVLGTTLELDEQRYTVIGVMPPGFGLPGQNDGNVWVLRPITEPTRRGPFYIRAIARLAHGPETEVATAQLRSLEASLNSRYPSSTEWTYSLTPLKEVVVGEVATTLLMLFAVVGCVLLIAVANVINLLLARGTSRLHEVAMRSALGASRGRLVRQLLTESAVLGVLGAGVGLGLAWLVTDLLVTRGSELVPRIEEVGIDTTVTLFALSIGIIAGVLAGTIPAINLRPARLGQTLKEGGRAGTAARSRGRTRNVLVVAEFALALAVLVSSALLVRSLLRMQTADLGVHTDGVVSFRLQMPSDPYSESEAARTFFAELKQRLTGLPGVASVAFSSSLPPDRITMTNNYTVMGNEPVAGQGQPTAEWILVSEGYFETMGIPLLRGRNFTGNDSDDQPRVYVVNQAFVRQHYPDRDPLTGRIQPGNWNPEGGWSDIVGVVGDVVYSGMADGAQPTVYAAHSQNLGWNNPFAVVRTSRTNVLSVARVQDVLQAVDPRMPLRQYASLEQLVANATAADRFRSFLFAILAAIALIMAATGIYGVMSYHVGTRQRETAIRRALGARSTRLVGDILREGLLLATAGSLLGVIGAVALAHTFSSLLFDISPTDVATYVAAVVLLVGVAQVACLVPSVRATRVDPVAALRDE
ncbi:MAG: ABC transporter permease [Gemmatimonadota bacterium]|nr:MAG: ABC transporter permease [Gemmatimonadota bacterium]